MVILKLTKPVPDEFECEVVNIDSLNKSEKRYYSLVRPCERYWELFESCKSFKNRLHQYYVFGELFDCEPHRINYDVCLKFRKTKDLKLLHSIIEWEQNLINTRLKTVEQNKVWDMREKPPDDFNGPLPEFIVKRQSSSLFTRLER